tara:strand:+ start:1663 stop:2088 length:426 start_codon:yes stop_codon:yes gene_type:complete
MKPDVKRILAKLSKEKVELGNIQKAEALIKEMTKLEQDLKSASKELQKFESFFTQNKKEIENYSKKKKYYSDIIQKYIDIKKGGGSLSMNIIDQLEKQANELGLDINKIPAIQKADNTFNSLADAVRPVMELYSSVTSLIK